MAETSLLLHEPGIAEYITSDTIELGLLAEQEGFESLWVSETYCHNAFTLLGAIATRTDSIQLGTAVVNVYSRSPALLGMSVASLLSLAPNRVTLALGVSLDHLVETWHGMEYERPLRRAVEVMEILRSTFGNSSIDYHGEIFDIGPYSIGFSIPKDGVDIYNAAMGPANCEMTGEYADGWLPTYVPPKRISELREQIDAGAEKADRTPTDIASAPVVTTAVQESSEAAEAKARESLAHELNLGYNSLLHQFGMGSTADQVVELWQAGEREAATATITEEMFDALTISGTPEECASQIKDFEEAGADQIVLRPTINATYADVENIVTHLG